MTLRCLGWGFLKNSSSNPPSADFLVPADSADSTDIFSDLPSGELHLTDELVMQLNFPLPQSLAIVQRDEIYRRYRPNG